MDEKSPQLPLQGLQVLDFAQFLAGPVAAMRLGDLGADVIKVERPQGGDLCRSLVVADQTFDGDSLLFHTFNRNKRSFAADLKQEADLAQTVELIRRADVMIHNFRPGVMERIGLDYETVQSINPRIVYGAVSGYGAHGPWAAKPGQDLLAQARSGLTWLSGNAGDGPVPVGFALLDIATGSNLVQGILAALVGRGVSGKGSLVEVDLMSSAFDLQFEQLTAFLNGDLTQPARANLSNANVYGAAPYGIFKTADGYLAIAMMPISRLAELFECDRIAAFAQSEALNRRNEINALLQDAVATKTTAEWLAILDAADAWCAEVLDWPELIREDAFVSLQPLQEITGPRGGAATTTRCPIKLDGRYLTSGQGAPALGQHTAEIRSELLAMAG